MLTATKDVLLPTTVTGSWPRPAWFTEALWGASFSERMNHVAYREQFGDAVAAVLCDQERAGLDILTNGDYHLDPDFAGRSWFLYPFERLGGVDDVRRESGLRGAGDTADASGHRTIFNEIFSEWRFPAIVDTLRERIPLEYDEVWRTAQERTNRPVKFGAISALCVGSMVATVKTNKYPDSRELMWDLAGLFNREYRRLIAAGCRVIQIEEPTLHYVAGSAADPGHVDFLVDCLNRELEGLGDAEVWLHTCWGNPAGQGATVGDYGPSIEVYMERIHADVWTIELKDTSPPVALEAFDRYKRSFPKKVAVGVVSHRTLQVDTPDDVANQIRRALRHIPAEHLVLSTNCGFGRQGASRFVASQKAKSIVRGANIVRRELGGRESS